MTDHPKDAESHYLMGIWHARQGLHARASEWFQKALSLGLPPGRILAGTRNTLPDAPSQHPYYAKQFQNHRHTLVHGPMIGNVTDRSATFWVRTTHPATVTIRASETPDFPSSTRAAHGQTLARNDNTGLVQLIGLKPSTTYFYRSEINGQASSQAFTKSFHTFGQAGKPTRFRLAFGGGAGYVPDHERAWDTIGAFDPQLLLLLGDNVYIDDPESLIMQRYTYYRRQSRPEWRTLTDHVPVYTIWDDHDFGTNDCWGGPEVDLPFWKPHYAFRTFRENWANPGYAGGDQQPGCWYQFQVGNVDFVMLDCRYYRTNPKGPHPTMLGPVQLNWLKRTLRDLNGTFKIIVSSVPWDFRTKGDSLDTWNGYQAEREAIFQFIESQRIEGVILMSADRHRSDAWRIDRPNGYPYFEFNSSRLTNQHVHREMTDAGALFSYNKKQSFGLVDFDTTLPDPTATFSVVTIDGEVVHDLTVPRSALQSP